MSNIYITEPATNGKVILKTTVGEIEVELWSKEAPLACRNFVQLCMEGYYNDTAFHRLVKGFIVQGGDPTGTGEGGESIYGKPFRTESHSRLSFNRRGLVGMACPEPNCNGSQFFFTLGEATELNTKHTLFGRVVGNTLFNMLRLAEVEVIKGDRPARLHRILKTEVILNPYDDIVPRRLPSQAKKNDEEEPVPTAKATKNFSLLSFGDEAEEEAEVVSEVAEKFRGKGKSAHDLVNDPRLSSEPVAVSLDDPAASLSASAELAREAEERRRRREDAANLETAEEREARAQRLAAVQAEREQILRDIARTNKLAKQREAEARKREAEQRERELAAMDEEQRAAKWEAEQRRKVEAAIKESKPLVSDLGDFKDEVATYRSRTKQLRARKDREAETMNLLSRFESRLLKEIGTKEAADSETVEREETKAAAKDEAAWLRCRLLSEEPAPARKVLDPSIDNPDRYDLFDPRNPLNVRKREGAVMDDPNKKKRKH
nr:unnamed protein product [Spirometra erinaceieuropaei]